MILCAASTRRFPTPLLPTWIDTNVSLHSGPGVNCSVCFVKKHQHWLPQQFGQWLIMFFEHINNRFWAHKQHWLVVWNISYVPKILVDHAEPTSESFRSPHAGAVW